MSDKKLIFRLHKFNIKNRTSKKKTETNLLTTKWASEIDRQFSKEEIQIACKFVKRCSTALVIRERQIKPTLGFHLTYTMAIIKKETKFGEAVEERGILFSSGRGVVLYSHYGNQCGGFSKA